MGALSPQELRLLAQMSGIPSGGASAVPRGTMSGPQDDTYEPNMIMRAIDYANRPYSTIMGAVTGLQGQGDPLQQAWKGLVGEEQYGFYDVLVNAGADPEGNVARLGGLGLDVTVGGVLDPVSYLTLGANKAGRIARAVGGASGKVPTRAEMAAAGQWDLIAARMPGGSTQVPLVPRGVSEAAAPMFDTAGRKIAGTRAYQKLGEMFGGVEKFASQYPGVSAMIRGVKGEAADLDAQIFNDLNRAAKDKRITPEMHQMLNRALENADVRPQVIDTLRELDVLRDPNRVWIGPGDTGKTGIRRNPADDAIGEMDRAAAGQQLQQIAPPQPSDPVFEGFHTVLASPEYLGVQRGAGKYIALDQPFMPDAGSVNRVSVSIDPKKIFDPEGLIDGTNAEQAAADFKRLVQRLRERSPELSQMDPHRGLSELRTQELRRMGYDAEVGWIDGPESRNRELVVFDTGRVRDAHVPAPQAARAAADDAEVLKSVIRNPDDLPIDAVRNERMTELIQRLDDIEPGLGAIHNYASDIARTLDTSLDLYMQRIRKLDPNATPPVAAYLKHMYPSHDFAMQRTARKVANNRSHWIRQRTDELAGEGMDRSTALRTARDEADQATKWKNIVDPSDKGVPEQFRRRKYDTSIEDANKLFDELGLNMRFETNTTEIASATYRDAQRWAKQFDMNDWANGRFGISADDFRAMSRAEQAKYVPIDFHVPWLSEGVKNPFQDRYIPKSLQMLMDKHTGAYRAFTSDEGFRSFLDVAHAFRRWWSAWTLAPFPSYHLRNLGSDVMLAHQAGLNPLTAQGMQAYHASAIMMGRSLDEKGGLVGKLAHAITPDDSAVVNNYLEGVNAALRQVDPNAPARTLDELREVMVRDNIIGSMWHRDLDTPANAALDSAMTPKPGAKMAEFLPMGGLRAEMAGQSAQDANKLLRFGFTYGQNQQDFTKGALWLDSFRDAVRHGQDFDNAALYATTTTRKHLFDYFDLTPFENNIMKLLAPFYTFTSKNLPLQIEMLATQPGRFAYLHRAYHGAWNGFEADLSEMDIPLWLRDNLGIPVRTVKDADGVEKVSIWNNMGWVPMTEINELGNAFRNYDGMGRFVLSRLNPMLKEPVEQIINYDTFTGRKIDDGEVHDLFGLAPPDIELGPMGVTNPRLVHFARNVRLVSELDRLNPGDWWTGVGQWSGTFTKDRAHRREAPQGERALRTFLGLNFQTVDQIEELNSRARRAQVEATRLQSRARFAQGRGHVAEAERMMEQSRDLIDEARMLSHRLNEVRRSRALSNQTAETLR